MPAIETANEKSATLDEATWMRRRFLIDLIPRHNFRRRTFDRFKLDDQEAPTFPAATSQSQNATADKDNLRTHILRGNVEFEKTQHEQTKKELAQEKKENQELACELAQLKAVQAKTIHHEQTKKELAIEEGKAGAGS